MCVCGVCVLSEREREKGCVRACVCARAPAPRACVCVRARAPAGRVRVCVPAPARGPGVCARAREGVCVVSVCVCAFTSVLRGPVSLTSSDTLFP